MSLKDRLRDFVTEVDPNAVKKPDLGVPAAEAAQAPSTAGGGSPAPQVFSAAARNVVPAPVKDDPITTAIKSKLRDSNYKRYEQFLLAVEKLTRYVPLEADRYRAAFETSNGLLVTDLQTALQDGLRKLDSVKVDAQSTYDSEVKARVGAKEQQLSSVQSRITQRREDIARIEQEIAQLQTEERELSGQIVTEKQDIDNTKQQLDSVCDRLKGQLQQEQTKLDQYIRQQ